MLPAWEKSMEASLIMGISPPPAGRRRSVRCIVKHVPIRRNGPVPSRLGAPEQLHALPPEGIGVPHQPIECAQEIVEAVIGNVLDRKTDTREDFIQHVF